LFVSSEQVHSHTFPEVSYKPKLLAAKEPTGAVDLLSHILPQPSQLALLEPISLPHQYLVSVPALAAYSHSA